jgi:hypothetical protein
MYLKKRLVVGKHESPAVCYDASCYVYTCCVVIRVGGIFYSIQVMAPHSFHVKKKKKKKKKAISPIK